MSTDTDTISISPRRIYPPHEVRDADKLAALTASMESDGWQGRAILAYEYAGAVVALTGSHRIAAARAADLDEIPVVLIHDEMVEGEDGEVSTGDVLRACRDLTALATVLRELGCDADHEAVALAEAEEATAE